MLPEGVLHDHMSRETRRFRIQNVNVPTPDYLYMTCSEDIYRGRQHYGTKYCTVCICEPGRYTFFRALHYRVSLLHKGHGYCRRLRLCLVVQHRVRVRCCRMCSCAVCHNNIKMVSTHRQRTSLINLKKTTLPNFVGKHRSAF